MRFKTNFAKEDILVCLEGDLDEKSAKETRDYLDEALSKYLPTRMILDFEKVDFMDSTGIGVLLGRYKKLKARDAELCVCHLNQQIDKVFRVSGLYQIIKAV